MSASGSKKVVALNSISRERSPGQRILGECRNQLEDGLVDWLRDVATPISEEFFVLAGSTREREKQTRYLDLRADIEKDWGQLIETFRRDLATQAERCQNQSRQYASNQADALEVPDFEGLKLIADEDLSEHIVIREFAAQLSETCDAELYALDRRVAALLGQEKPVDNTNPLAPPVICQALVDSCAALGCDAEDRLLLLRRLERHLHLALPPIYQSINTRLIERSILPDLKRTYRRGNSVAGTDSSTPAGEPTLAPISPSTPFSTTQNATTTTGEGMLDALQRLVQARSASYGLAGATEAGATGIPGKGGSVASEMLPDAATLSHLFLTSLDTMQHAPVGEGESPIINRVRIVRDSESARQIGHLESVTIDIVAMLFDFIFDDGDIPPAIKALVSRLQIPVLKLAILDHEFFADRLHPARRFLGSISGIAVRWGNSVDETDPFYRKLAELVERIQNEFECDVEIFGTALSELEAFVDERENEEQNTVLAAADLVVQREQEAETWERTQQAVKSFSGEQPTPLIESFVNNHWIYALQKVALENNADSPAWQSATNVVKDLDWSVQAKKTPDDRLKLVSMLPRLLTQLNKGLDSIGADPAERRSFFDTLVEYHSAALKGEALGAAESNPTSAPPPSSAVSEQSPPPSTEQDGDLLTTRSIDNGVEVEEIILVGASPIWRASDREAFARVSELKRGDWIEFRQEDGTNSRERLNWISPQRGILVFSNHRSAKAISISPEALARQLRNGNADIVNDTPLFERALSGVLDSLNAA